MSLKLNTLPHIRPQMQQATKFPRFSTPSLSILSAVDTYVLYNLKLSRRLNSINNLFSVQQFLDDQKIDGSRNSGLLTVQPPDRLLARGSFIDARACVCVCELVSKISFSLIQVVLKIHIHHFFRCQACCLHSMELQIFNELHVSTFLSECSPQTNSPFFFIRFNVTFLSPRYS